jgi:cytochrome c-type biogenesis protein CcmF
MLIHPPIVFLAYAAWAVPCALALSALAQGAFDEEWMQMARPWAIAAWTLLGAGLLLGAHWAYQELGWGGYWGWDPVENGSLLPWLTGTAMIHACLAWRHRGSLKKTALSLAIATFALCNFATFLTRSGIFSSVHAFSESPIGWMFLGLMAALVLGGGWLVFRRRAALAPRQPLVSLVSRESFILVAVFLLLALAAVVMIGTLIDPVSKAVFGRSMQVGPAFYNNVLAPVGIGLLAVTAAVPLLQWGGPPAGQRRRLLFASMAASLIVAAVAVALGVRHLLALAVISLVALTIITLPAAWLHESFRRGPEFAWPRPFRILRDGRRKYAAFGVHLGFVAVAVGVAGSSLGTQRIDVALDEGQSIEWNEWQIRHARLAQREAPDKLVAEAVLEVSRAGRPPVELRPARHFHLLQNDWTTEVAIHSTWSSDFYTILHAGVGGGRVELTFVSNPLIRWIWVGGMIAAASAILTVWPTRASASVAADRDIVRTDSAPLKAKRTTPTAA